MCPAQCQLGPAQCQIDLRMSAFIETSRADSITYPTLHPSAENGLDIDLGLLPLLPQSIQQPAQAWGQVLLGIFNNAGEVLTQVVGLCGKGDVTLKESRGSR
jgi:hypothetical protein